MRWLVVPLSGLALAACGDDLSPADQAAQDARDIAQVEAINASKAPALPIAPQAIGYPDIERHDLFGAGCNFAPDGGGLGALFLAQSDAGYFKLEGDIVRLAADAGSTELPLGARQEYDGKAHSASLTLDETSGEQSGIETMDYRGALTIRDAAEQVVYQAEGIVQCGA